MIGKLLALALVLLIAGKLFFRPQLQAFSRWLDGLVTVMVVAIAVAYAVSLVLVLTSR